MDAYQLLREYLDTPELISRRKQEHPYCRECLTGCNIRNYISSQPERRKREFLLERGDPVCRGVYTQEDVFLGTEMLKEHGFGDMTIEEVKSILNPSFWLTTHVSLKADPFTPFWYQDRALRCTAMKKVLRMSRRAGKTEMLASLICYLLFMSEKPYYKILVICPQKAQAKEIWDKLLEFIESNPELENSVGKKKQQPYYELIIANSKNRVRIFTAGSKSGSKALSVRGQAAELIIIDEMDYLSEEDIPTIMPVLTDVGGGNFIGATTLKGTEGMFYKFCHTTSVKEFYVPFKSRPDWTPEKEQDARDTCPTQLHWDLEYEVKWTGKLDGVFQRMFINAAFNRKRLSYGDLNFEPGWSYFVGVDWNGDNNGTRIMVIGYNPTNNMVYSVRKEVVAFKGWTQTLAINKIIDINREWRPLKIVIDKGFGQFQDEVLRGVGLGAQIEIARGSRGEAVDADSRLADIVEVVDFGGKIELTKLYTEQGETEKHAKQYLIENLQRIFEQEGIYLCEDEELRSQLLEYTVLKHGQRGTVYKAGLVGDHDLDALALASFGFSKHYQPEFRETRPVIDAGIVRASLENVQKEMDGRKLSAPDSKAKKEEMNSVSSHQLPIMPVFDRTNFDKGLSKSSISRDISKRPAVNLTRIGNRRW